MKPRSSADCVRALNSMDGIVTRLLKIPGGMNDLYGRVKAEAATIRAANYDRDFGNRVDADGFNLPDYADPTGDTAADGRAAELMDRLLTDVAAAHDALVRLDGMLHNFLRDKPAQVVEDGPGDMWCRSCWRVKDWKGDAVRNAIEKRYNKKRLCLWCGEHVAAGADADDPFPLDEQGWPPLELLTKRLSDPKERLYQRDIDEYRRKLAS